MQSFCLVRESKKERSAYEAHVKEQYEGGESAGFGPGSTADGDDALDRIA